MLICQISTYDTLIMNKPTVLRRAIDILIDNGIVDEGAIMNSKVVRLNLTTFFILLYQYCCLYVVLLTFLEFLR